MAGVPSEAEVQTQWSNAVNILEKTRVHADVTMGGAAGLFDTLEQSLEGEYTPDALAGWSARYRAGLSSLLDAGIALEALEPILLEYMAAVAGPGGGFRDTAQMFRALYEHFVINSRTVESRAITYDPAATTSNGFGGAIIGNGSMSRLTVDENAFNLEFCHVEVKRFRCRSDQNTGADEHAEEFEMLGDPASQDALSRSAFGSGTSEQASIRAHNAGSGDGGSQLTNSSFSQFTASATSAEQFNGWTETLAGGAVSTDITQSTVAAEVFRGSPGVTTAASCKIALGGAGEQVILTQPLADMRLGSLDPDTPYFLRLMWNGTEGSASTGTIKLRLGNQEVTVPIASSGWQELLIPVDTNLWTRNFNQDGFGIDIEVIDLESGYVVIDDVLFAEWDLIDGTYWFLRGSTTPFLLDDTLLYTDTGGAPATAIIQWWNFIAGLGYLPSTTGTPTFTEPV